MFRSETAKANSPRNSESSDDLVFMPELMLKQWQEPRERQQNSANELATPNLSGQRPDLPRLQKVSMSNITVLQRYKTNVCRTFERGGPCSFGEKCDFAHSMEELRTIEDNEREGLEKIAILRGRPGISYGGAKAQSVHGHPNGAEPQQPVPTEVQMQRAYMHQAYMYQPFIYMVQMPSLMFSQPTNMPSYLGVEANNQGQLGRGKLFKP